MALNKSRCGTDTGYLAMPGKNISNLRCIGANQLVRSSAIFSWSQTLSLPMLEFYAKILIYGGYFLGPSNIKSYDKDFTHCLVQAGLPRKQEGNGTALLKRNPSIQSQQSNIAENQSLPLTKFSASKGKEAKNSFPRVRPERKTGREWKSLSNTLHPNHFMQPGGRNTPASGAACCLIVSGGRSLDRPYPSAGQGYWSANQTKQASRGIQLQP